MAKRSGLFKLAESMMKGEIGYIDRSRFGWLNFVLDKDLKVSEKAFGTRLDEYEGTGFDIFTEREIWKAIKAEIASREKRQR